MPMDIQRGLYRGVVNVRKNDAISGLYDVELANTQRIVDYDSFECHAVLYPYSRRISSENFVFEPFEEYAKDISSNQHSIYFKTANNFSKCFGAILLFLLVLILYIVKPFAFFSVEYLVSLLWAYLIGKEIGGDIERMLVDFTKKSRFSLMDNYYPYELEKGTTLTKYSKFAKECRYGKSSLLPAKFDFVEQSNSMTVRMFFNKDTLLAAKNTVAHLFSARFDGALLKDFEKDGYMFGFKLSFNKHFMGFRNCFEVFQSVNKDRKGCLDADGRWVNDAIFYRRTLVIGRCKFYRSEGLLNNENIFG